MNLLLDTHVLVWFLLADPRLPMEDVGRLRSDETVRWVSPVSVWEILLLAEHGRLVLPGPAVGWLSQELAAGPFREAQLTWEIAMECRRLPFTYEDPADRFLAATARVNGLTLMTADAKLKALKGVQVLPVRARRR